MSLFTELMNAIGEIALASFAPLKMLQNLPNVAFIVAGFAILLLWIKIMRTYAKEAAQNGTIE